MSELQVYTIPAENMPGLMAKLDGLSKKSVKLIGKPINLTLLSEVRKPVQNARGVQVTDEDGNLCWALFYKVTIDAETPRIAGWSFIATIDHSASAGNIVRTAPNAKCEIPEKYRTVGPICDHCNKIRSRRDTFVLRCEATGEFKQIGRQCIRDFIGYDVEQVVAMAELVSSAAPSDNDGAADWGGGIRDRAYIKVSTYLAHVAATMRTEGWVSRKDEEYGRGPATASLALRNMFPPPNSGHKRIPLIDKDFETARAAMAWAISLGQQPRASEFDYNLSVLVQEEMVESRSTGMLAAAIPAFFRASEREYQRAERRRGMRLDQSQFIGNVGDKIGTKKGQSIAPFEAVLYGFHSFSGTYGPTYVYRFQAVDGNVFVWFASEGPAEALGLGGLDASRRVRVRITGGTVKSHKEYDNVKQTYLTRTKVEVLAPELEATG